MGMIEHRYYVGILFLRDSLDLDAFAAIVRGTDLGFTPSFLEVGPRRGKFTTAKLDALRGPLPDLGVGLEGDGGRLDLSSGNGSTHCAMLHWTRDTPPDLAAVDEVAGRPGFSSAAFGDAEDVFWQSEDQISTYKLAGRSTWRLRKGWDPTFERKNIDTSRHPGRRQLVPGVLIWPAATMWFGPPAFTVIDGARLDGAPGRRTALPGGVMRVDLYEVGQPVRAVRAAQRAFRSQLGWDDFEISEDRIHPALRSDPDQELHTGTFEHGGEVRTIVWLDEHGTKTRRSLAARGDVVEHGPGRTVLWRGSIDPPPPPT